MPEASGLDAHRRRLRDTDVTIVEHIGDVLADIRTRDQSLGAFVSVGGEQCLRDAEQADAFVRAHGRSAWRRQPLLGVPVAVKDLIQTADLPTRRGSLIPNSRPATDAPVVARLRAAGAIIVGKTTTSEYGWSASTESRLGPATRNPWDVTRSAGGSSGGSAAAVAADLCAAAIGTDGAGSIRIPAAFCGVVGFKPSFGRIPYVPPCADRLAHLGPLTATVADAAEMARMLFGSDPLDPDSLLITGQPHRDAARLRIGWIEMPGTSEAVREVAAHAIAAMTEQGHLIDHLETPYEDPYPALVDLLAAAEAAGSDPADDDRADPGRLAVIRYGRRLSAAAVMHAEQARLALRSRMAAVMQSYDVLAMATVPIEAFAADAIGPAWASDATDLRWLAWSPATYPANLTGQPAISLPAGLSPSGLPVGVQLVGAVGADGLLLSLAQRTEAILGRLPSPSTSLLKG